MALDDVGETPIPTATRHPATTELLHYFAYHAAEYVLHLIGLAPVGHRVVEGVAVDQHTGTYEDCVVCSSGMLDLPVMHVQREGVMYSGDNPHVVVELPQWDGEGMSVFPPHASDAVTS